MIDFDNNTIELRATAEVLQVQQPMPLRSKWELPGAIAKIVFDGDVQVLSFNDDDQGTFTRPQQPALDKLKFIFDNNNEGLEIAGKDVKMERGTLNNKEYIYSFPKKNISNIVSKPNRIKMLIYEANQDTVR